MSLVSLFNSFDMNSSYSSNNSDEMCDELNWSAEFATPGKTSDERLSLTFEDGSPRTPPSSKRFLRGSVSRASLQLLATPSTPATLLRRSSQSELSPSVLTGSRSQCSVRRSSRISTLKRSSSGTSSPVSPLAAPFVASTPADVRSSTLSEKKRRKMCNENEEELNDVRVALFSKLRRPVPANYTRHHRDSCHSGFDLNQSRYRNEFVEHRLIGKGEFGEVYKCQNKVDRCFYALKRLIKPLAGSNKETTAMREVTAHALLGKHQHILQYYSAWAEDKHMIIQNEYCNGGSLLDKIVNLRINNEIPQERDLIQILVQVSKGLRYMHSMGLAHLDIKPGNIFISHREVADDENRTGTCYKIGDLGLVTTVSDPVVEEGDVRYLPLEIMQENFSDLTKADVFSLALTVYETGTSKKLPKHGSEWHAIREGKLEQHDNMSDKLHGMMLRMIRPDVKDRPSPATILKNPFLISQEEEKIFELTKKLHEEKIENLRLLRELEKAKDSPLSKAFVGGGSSRLVGKQLNRSMSIA